MTNKTWRIADGVGTLIPPEYATHEEYEAALRAEIERLRAWAEEYERLRAAAMKLDGYWLTRTYGPEMNVVVRENVFAELRDLLGLKPKTYS